MMPRFTAFFVAFVSLNGLVATPADSATNVLMICVDDLKPTIGTYGDSHAITPNIDALAKRGIRFDSAYCNQAVCSPSRNALMTSLRPQTIGIYDLATNFRLAVPNAVTMSQQFMSHGYHAAAMGKIYHVGHGNDDDAASWNVPLFRPRARQYVNPSSIENHWTDKDGKKRGPATESGVGAEDDTYADGKIAKEAVERLQRESTSTERPFFLAVGFLKPHLPFVAPQKYWDMYDPATLPMPTISSAPEGAPEYAPTNSGELHSYSDMRDKRHVDAETTRHLIHGYYAATTYVDAQIGMVLQALDRNGLAENTIVLLWGDHGWHLGDHAMWCKHTNYEQAARIPLIVASPSTPPSARGSGTAAMVETVDIYPTLCELADLPIPAGLDGNSFGNVLDDPGAAARPYVTHVYPRGGRIGRAIRDPRYRMVEWKQVGQPANTAEIELYDYATDPLETKNLAASFPDIVDKMRAELAKQPEAKSPLKRNQTTERSPSNAVTKRKVDRNTLFHHRDADGDGFLTLNEFMTGQPDPDRAPQRFVKFDADDDGKLSIDEFVRSGKPKDQPILP